MQITYIGLKNLINYWWLKFLIKEGFAHRMRKVICSVYDCDDHSLISSTPAVQNMKYFIYYTSFHSSREIWTQLIDLTPNVWLHSSVGRASHRCRGGHGFESRWSLDFFFSGFLFPAAQVGNLLRWSFFNFIWWTRCYHFRDKIGYHGRNSRILNKLCDETIRLVKSYSLLIGTEVSMSSGKMSRCC